MTEPFSSRDEGEADRTFSSSPEKDGERQGVALLCRGGGRKAKLSPLLLEEEEEQGKTLFPSVEEDGNGEGLRHRPQKREGKEQGSRLSI